MFLVPDPGVSTLSDQGSKKTSLTARGIISYNYLVGGLEHFRFFHSVGNFIYFIIPTDELTPSCFRGVGQPPTR